MKIGICGFGFVGKALYNGFSHFGMNDFVIYDPFKFPDVKPTDLLPCDMVFICVPTPMAKDGSMDVSMITDALNNLSTMIYRGVVVIKSTVTPLHIKELIDKYKVLTIITNPEFLTERSADQDFINTKWVVIGGTQENTKKLAELSKKLWPDASVSEVSAEAAMMMKYMTNCWFATKVSLMNEFYKLYQSLGCTDWNELISAFATDIRVGPSHLSVPGPDGDFGWGGKCFPKDLNAILFLAKTCGIQHEVLQAAWNDNEIFRNNKDWLRIKWATS